MAHYGTLRDYRFVQTEDDADDIRGSALYGINDEKLGKIDDVVFDHETGEIRYVVVDTGGWLSSKQFIVPADQIRPSTEHDDDFTVSLNKAQIENFPPYNEKDVESQEKWRDYEGRYRSKWETSPVMHRAETDRNITPTTAQVTQGSGASGPRNWESPSPTTPTRESAPSSTVGTPASVSTGSERVIPPTSSGVVISSNATGIGARWDTFQARLRQRRREITHGCTTCTVGPVAERPSAADERKAV
jgi:sporulation protein YlmC with PRC-barrel domain